MENFDAPAQGFVEIGRTERHDHEFLDVHGIIGVRATVDDIHHRDGSVRGWIGRVFRQIFVERLAHLRCSSARGGHGDG